MAHYTDLPEGKATYCDIKLDFNLKKWLNM